MEPENFVPMVHRDGYYEVLLRGGIRVPEEHYADLCVTEEYVLCCYRTRCYELNLPTTFFTPARDTDGRPYRMGWTGFCVWAEEPKKVFRIYDVDGETLYLKYGAAYYKSVRRRFPVPDRRGLARRTGQLTMGN